MTRYVLVGAVVFLVLAVGFAPAGLVDRILERTSQTDLVNARGTVWRGAGELFVDQVALGEVSWAFRFTALLRGRAGADWTLSQRAGALTGYADAGFSTLHVRASGDINAAAANEWLDVYDITLSGDFSVRSARADLHHGDGRLEGLGGEIRWSGGLVRYVLSGLLREVTLPPMTATLGMDDRGFPQAVVFTDAYDTPLLIASQGQAGFVKIGITKLFTKLLDNPWPGSDPDHEIVLEVEEQVF